MYRSLHAYMAGKADVCFWHAVLQRWMESAKPPKWLWRSIAAVVLGGQVATRILKGVFLVSS